MLKYLFLEKMSISIRDIESENIYAKNSINLKRLILFF